MTSGIGIIGPSAPADEPSVLAVTSQMPWPLDSGGHLRTYHVLRALAGRFHVRVVAASSAAQCADSGAALERAGLEARAVTVPPRSSVGESARVLVAALRREPYVLFGRHRRRAVWRALCDEVKRRRPDVVYLDHLDSLVYAGVQPDVPLVIDMHNVYSRLASRAAAEAGGVVRRRYLRREAALIAQMEQRAARRVHTILAVSDEEARYFSEIGAARVVVVPNGVDCRVFASLPAAERTGPPTILYVGALSWPPNRSAVWFLATEVLPIVRRSLPETRLMIVTKHPPADLLALARDDDHVRIAANVPDVVPCFRDAHVLAVPLQAGGGTRLKILEAFAAGLPVVSTRVGCEGLPVIHGEHLVVAERSEFASAVLHMLLDGTRARRLAERARALVSERYDWGVVGDRVRQAVAWAAARGRPYAAAVPDPVLATGVPDQ